MSVFVTNKAILLLTRDSLQLMTKSQPVQKLTFPTEAVKHQEIVDRRLFEKVVADFFSRLKKQEAVLLLTNDIIFQKQLPQTASPEDVEIFFNTIPFPQNSIAKKRLRTVQNMFLFGTNRDLYQTIVSIANQYLWVVKEALPLVIFSPYLQEQEISYQTLDKALKHTEFIEAANFLKDEKVENTKKQEKVPARSVPLKQYLMLIGSLLFLFIALAIAAINLGLLHTK